MATENENQEESVVKPKPKVVITDEAKNDYLVDNLKFTRQEVEDFGDILRGQIDANIALPKGERTPKKEFIAQNRALINSYKATVPDRNVLGPGANIHIPKFGEKRDFEGSQEITSPLTPTKIKKQKFLEEMEEKEDFVSLVEHFKGSRGQELLNFIGEGEGQEYIDRLNQHIVKFLGKEYGEDKVRIDPNSNDVQVYSDVMEDWFTLNKSVIQDMTRGTNILEMAGGIGGGILGAVAGAPSGPGAVGLSIAFASAGAGIGSMLDAFWNADKIKADIEWKDATQTLANSVNNAVTGAVIDVGLLGVGKVAKPVLQGVGKTVASKLSSKVPTELDVENIAENLQLGKEKRPIGTIKALNESIRKNNPKYLENNPIVEGEPKLGNYPIQDIKTEDIREALLNEVDIQTANVLARRMSIYTEFFDNYTGRGLREGELGKGWPPIARLTKLDLTDKDHLKIEDEIVKGLRKSHSDDKLVKEYLDAVGEEKLTRRLKEEAIQKKHHLSADELAEEYKEAYVNPYLEVAKRPIFYKTRKWFDIPVFTQVRKSAEDLVKDRTEVLASKAAKREADNILKTHKKLGSKDYKQTLFGEVEATDEEVALKLLASQKAGPALIREVSAMNEKAAKEMQGRFDLISEDKDIVFGADFARKLHDETSNYDKVVKDLYKDIKNAGINRVGVVKGPNTEPKNVNITLIRDAIETARNKDAVGFSKDFIDNLLKDIDDSFEGVLSSSTKKSKKGKIIPLDLGDLLDLRTLINRASNEADKNWKAWPKLESAKKHVDGAIEVYAKNNMGPYGGDYWLRSFKTANLIYADKKEAIKIPLFKKLSGAEGATVTPDQMKDFILNSAQDVTNTLEKVKNTLSRSTSNKLDKATLQSYVDKNSIYDKGELNRDFIDYAGLYNDVKNIDFQDEPTKAKVKLLKEFSTIFNNDKDLARINLEKPWFGSRMFGGKSGIASNFEINPIASVKWNILNNFWKNFKNRMHSTGQARLPHSIRMLGRVFENVNSELDERKFLSTLKDYEGKDEIKKNLAKIRESEAAWEKFHHQDMRFREVDYFSRNPDKYYSGSPITKETLESFREKAQRAHKELGEVDKKIKTRPKPIERANLTDFDADEAIEPTRVTIQGEGFVTYNRKGQHLSHWVDGKEIQPNDVFNPKSRYYDDVVKVTKKGLVFTKRGLGRVKKDNFKGIQTPDGRVFLFDDLFKRKDFKKGAKGGLNRMQQQTFESYRPPQQEP